MKPPSTPPPPPRYHFKFGTKKFEPTIDFYNIFNNNAVTSAVTTIGSSLGRPSAIIMGRLVRVGGRIAF